MRKSGIDTAESENRAFSFIFRDCRSTDRGSAKRSVMLKIVVRFKRQCFVVFVKGSSKNDIATGLQNVKHLFAGLFPPDDGFAIDVRKFFDKRPDLRVVVQPVLEVA